MSQLTKKTRHQQQAQIAFEQVERWNNAISKESLEEQVSFAKSFPALIYQCGLAQAIAFAESKKRYNTYLESLTAVIQMNTKDLSRLSRVSPVLDYMRISREVISAAGWIKRYVDTLYPSSSEE